MATNYKSSDFTVDLDPLTGFLTIRVDAARDAAKLDIDLLKWTPGTVPTLEVSMTPQRSQTFDLRDINAITVVIAHDGTGPSNANGNLQDIVEISNRVRIPVTVEYADAQVAMPAFIRGGSGDDFLTGSNGNAIMFGRNGDDTLIGGQADDRLFGGNGMDLLIGSAGRDFLRGEKGNDTLEGGDGNDRLNGGHGHDLLFGDAGRDIIHAGGWHDTIVGGAHNDLLHGGRGFDTAIFSGSVYDYTFRAITPHKSDKSFYVIGPDGWDKVLHVEALQFDDYTYYVDGRNNAPFTRPDYVFTDEDTSINLAGLMANDFDIEGDHFSFSSVVPSGSGASVTIAADGTIDYSPVGAFDYLALGEVGYDTFVYTVTDSYGGERSDIVTVEIQGLNDAPEFLHAVSDTVGRINEGDSSNVLSDTGQLVFEDKDVSDTHTVTTEFVSASSGATSSVGSFEASIPASAPKTVDWNYEVADQTIQYLAQGQTLVETFRTTVHDPNGGTDTIDTLITLVGQNDAPIARLDTTSVVGEGSAVTVDVLANDTDVDTGAVLSLSNARIVSGGGSVSIVDNKLVFDTGTAYEALGAGQKGEAVVEYTITDEFGASAQSAAFITVNGLADAAKVQKLTAFSPTMSVDYATSWHFARLAEQGVSSTWTSGSTQATNGYQAGFQVQTGSQSMFGLGVDGVNFSTTGTITQDPLLKGYSFTPGFDFELIEASVGVSASADALLSLDFSPSAGFSAGTVSGGLGVNAGISGVSVSGGFTQLATNSSVNGATISQTLPQTMTYGIDGAIDASFSTAMSYSAKVRGPWIPTDLEGGGYYLPDFSESGTIFNQSVSAAGSYNLLRGSVDLSANSGALSFADDLLSHTITSPISSDLANISFGGNGVVTSVATATGITVKTVKDLVDIGLDIDDILSFIPQLKALQLLDAYDIPVGIAKGSYVMADFDYSTGFDFAVESNLDSKYSVDLLFDRPVFVEGFDAPVIALRNADWNNLPGIKAAVAGPVTVTPVFNSQVDYTSEIDLLLTGTLLSSFGAMSASIDIDIAGISIHEKPGFGPIFTASVPIFTEDIADLADTDFSVFYVDQFQGDSFSLFG